MAGIGDNSVTGDELRQFVEQIESLNEEKRAVAVRQKELFSEAKAQGYDTRIMRKVITRRKRDKDDLAEEDSLLEMYESAIVNAAARMLD